MSLNANKSRLMAITKDLSIHWEQTKERWQDSKSLEFEKKYMEEIEDSVDSAVTVIDQLEKLINQIRSDCE